MAPSINTPFPCPSTPNRASPTSIMEDYPENDSWETPQRNFSHDFSFEICTEELEDNDEQRSSKRKTRSPRRVVVTPPSKKTRDQFQSVLDQPFAYWEQLDKVLEDGLSFLDKSWKSKSVRGRMIHLLVHFLELKVGLNLYLSECLLVPTVPLDQAWRSLVLETDLYQKITYYIQEFHGKPRKTIPYSSLRNLKASPAEQSEKLRRTQSLFEIYFRESMPESIRDLAYDNEIDDISTGASQLPPVFLLPRFMKNAPSYNIEDLQQPMLEDDDNDDDLLGLNLVE